MLALCRDVSQPCDVRLELEVSAGELVDRITILELKAKRLSEAQRECVAAELARACCVRDKMLEPTQVLTELTDQLRAINGELWGIEEELRSRERLQEFGQPFIELARKVYCANDRRAAIKRKIDLLFGLAVGDIKSHPLPDL